MNETNCEMFHQVFWRWLYVVICIIPGPWCQGRSGFIKLLGNQADVNFGKSLIDRC